MNIVFVHSSCIMDQYQVIWRCMNLAQAIERTGQHHATVMDIPSFISHDENNQKVCKNADLIVIHRYNIGPVLQAALYWKTQKKKLVLDIDEAINLITDEMENFKVWYKGEFPANFFGQEDPGKRIEPPPIRQLSWSMTLMDAVTVSSMRLAGDWEKFGHVWQIDDYINFNRYLTIKTLHKDEIWIGIGGDIVSSQTYRQSGMIDALEEVCRQRPKVRLFLGNVPPELIKQINIPSHQKVTYSWLPPEDWEFQLSNLDIGLAPSLSEYDFRRSRNRALEYQANRIPWIASDHIPYRDLKEFGILVSNTKESWSEGLISMIDSLKNYQIKANGRPYLYAVSQDINENIGKLISVYESILKEK